VDRINVADVFGGADMVAQAILYNFGIEVDHWAFVNFEGFTAAVDALGGITVEVGGYLHDECGGEMYTYTPGTYHMDGSTALCYVRMRKRSSDFDRLRRQQEVLRAVYRRVLSLDGLTRVPQLYGQFNRLLKTDMGLEDLVPLVPLAADLASGEAELSAYSLGPSLAVPWRVPSSGASVLLPNRKGIRELLEEAYALEDGGLETSQGWQGDP
jgi:LCP family protein required for cell wall assembly